jgi:hypothetical protein
MSGVLSAWVPADWIGGSTSFSACYLRWQSNILGKQLDDHLPRSNAGNEVLISFRRPTPRCAAKARSGLDTIVRSRAWTAIPLKSAVSKPRLQLSPDC